MPATQQQINYGAVVNDGQGDPLRTAFIKTDNNFDAIWAAGPVGSNVTITNNTITATNTNGELRLQTNGTGNVRIARPFIPTGNRLYDLGAANLRFGTVYANTLDTINFSVSTLTVNNIQSDDSAFVQISDGLDVNGNVSAQYFIGDGSQLTNLPGGGGDYGNSNVAAYLSTGVAVNIVPAANAVWSLGNATNQWANLWVSNNTIYIGNVAVGVTAGNVLTVNGNAVLTDNSNSTITTTGNITANFFIGNGSQLTGIAATYGNANVAANLAAFGSNPISTTGNITTTANISGAYVKGNGSELTNLPAPVVTQDISSNGAMSIMLYDGIIKYNNNATVEPVSGNITGGNILTGGLISATGNITANFFIGNIGQPTEISSPGTDLYITAGNTNGCSVPGGDTIISGGLGYGGISHSGGNVTLRTGDNYANQWNFAYDGNLTLPSNTFAVLYANGTQVSLGGGNTGNVTFSDQIVIGTGDPEGGGGLYLAPGPDSIANSAVQYLRVRGGDNVTHIHLDTGNNAYYDQYFGADSKYVKLEANGNVVINSDDGANSATWTFGSAGAYGELTLPAGEGIIKALDDTIALVSLNTTTGNANSVYLGSGGGLGFNDQDIGGNWLEIFRSGTEPEIRVPVGRGNLNIQTAEGGNVYNWTFDNTGNLTLPTEGYLLVQTGIIGAGGSPAPTLSGFSDIATTGSTGNISASGNLIVSGYANISGTINGGNISLSGNITAGNFLGSGSNVDLVAGAYTTTFDNTGNVAMANGTVSMNNLTVTGVATLANTATVTSSNYAIGYRDIPQVTFSANATAALADAGKHYYSTTAGNLALTLPDNSSVAFPTGTALIVVVNAAGNVLVNQGSGVTLYQAGGSSTGNRVVGAYGLATVMKVAANTWVINGTGVY